MRTGPRDQPHEDQSANPAQALNAPALDGLQRLSALDTVRARIALAIDLGLLTPGERLPSTDQIAQALDVGEITVRRALTSLCQDGLLDRRPGRNGGTRVAERPARGKVSATEAYRAQAGEVHTMIDQRVVLECGIAHLAASNADSAAVEHLQRIADEMDQVESWAAFHRCDERFHLAVADAAGIGAAAASYHSVLKKLYRYYVPYPLDALRQSNLEHHALVGALRRRDVGQAADIARRHVEVLRRTMFVAL